jgi:hypothetical protein
MSDSPEPPRFTESNGADRVLSELFRAAERDLPSDAELARLRGRLAPVFAGGTPAGSRSGLSKLSRWGLGVLALGAASVVAYVATRAPEQAPPAPTASAPASETTPSAPAPASADVAPSVQIPESAPTADSAASTATSKAPRDRNPSEATLLEQARRALANNPAQALALTHRHQALYPQGLLAQEREVIAIEALRRLGQGSKASERATGFERKYPDSAHRRTVEKGLGQ